MKSHLILLAFFISLVHCDLQSVVLLSRHGTRVANENVLDICPNYKENLDKYLLQGVQLGGLTPKGMVDLFALGEFTKKKYIETGFLQRHYFARDVRVEAVSAERTIQSGIIWGQALYPAGTGSPVYPHAHSTPAPMPVHSTPDDLDDILECRVATCKAQIGYDTRVWDGTYGVNIIQKNQNLVQEMGQICGVDLLEKFPYKNISHPEYNLGDAIKDITDAMTFDYDQLAQELEGVNLTPMEGMSWEKFLKFRELAISILYGRLYSTEEKVNYMSGKFPSEIVNHFDNLVSGVEKTKLYAYHGHREILYAVAKFQGMNFDIRWPGLPSRAIPAGTTMFWELHNNTRGDYFVRTYYWIPGLEQDVPSTKIVQLDFCSDIDCPYDEFKAYFQGRLDHFGDYVQHCTRDLVNMTDGPHTPSRWMPDGEPEHGITHLANGDHSSHDNVGGTTAGQQAYVFPPIPNTQDITHQTQEIMSRRSSALSPLFSLIWILLILVAGIYGLQHWKQRQRRDQYHIL